VGHGLNLPAKVVQVTCTKDQVAPLKADPRLYVPAPQSSLVSGLFVHLEGGGTHSTCHGKVTVRSLSIFVRIRHECHWPYPLGEESSMTESLQSSRQALLEINGAATYLDDTVRHLRRLVDERRIPFVKVGGKIRFRIADLDTWLDESTVPAAR
jgi:excisionase family DNA binding protein